MCETTCFVLRLRYNIAILGMDTSLPIDTSKATNDRSDSRSPTLDLGSFTDRLTAQTGLLSVRTPEVARFDSSLFVGSGHSASLSSATHILLYWHTLVL